MADWIEDDWDSSSPIGSPSSSLPQSIREVLESVRAECSAGKFGAYCIDKPKTTTETNVPHEDKLTSHDEHTMEIGDAKEMTTEPHGQTLFNSDNSQELPQDICVASQDIHGSVTKKIHPDFTKQIQSNLDTHKVDTTSPHLNVYEKERKNREDVPDVENMQSRVGIGKELKPSSVIDGRITKNPVPEDLLRLKQANYGIMGRTLADYQKTKADRWIKIDWPTNKLSPNKVTPTTQHCLMNPIHPKYESLPAVHPKEIESMGILRLKTQIEVNKNSYEVMKQDYLKRKASTEHDAPARKDILEAHSVTNKIDPNKKSTPENHLRATKPGTQMTMSIDLTDDPDSPKIDEVSMKRPKMDGSPPQGVDKMWAAENSKMAVENTQTQECFSIQKRVGKSCETIGLSGDVDQGQKKEKNAGYLELTDDSLSSEHKSEEGGNHRVDQVTSAELEEADTNGMDEILADDWMVDDEWNVKDRNSISNVKSHKHWSSDDSETSMEGQSSKGSPTNGLPGAFQKGSKQVSDFEAGASHYITYYQDDANLEWADNKSDKNNTSNEPKSDLDKDDGDDDDNENQTTNTWPIEQSTKGETLHNELKEKYMNMHFSKEMSPMKKEYGEYEAVCEEIEEFARAESPMQKVKNIRMKLFDDDEQQAINKNIIHINTGKTKKDESDEETTETSVMIWRQELLSSDFNLIYGSLRAVLMRNVSKDDNHRLIQTMIATMSEIEEVTMGEGNPTQQSVRCETPESSTEFDEIEDEKESDSGVKEEIQKEPPPLRLQVHGEECRQEREAHNRFNLRGREMALNLRRIKELMRVCSDRTLACLICKKRGLPDGRVCRACAAMTYRIERKYTIGAPLPTCNHVNYSGGVSCKSCRFRKFSFLSMTATDTRVREVRTKDCPICKKTSYYTRGWKCTKCDYFFLKLTHGKGPMPTCKHNGEFPITCAGCRCYNLQEEWAKYEYRDYPLPLVKKNDINCEKMDLPN